MRLSWLAEWTIMAVWLLLPAGTAESAAAECEAADLRRRLADREAARRLAEWLERRPQLGREMFPRGAGRAGGLTEPAAEVTELLRACLKLLELPLRKGVCRLWLPLLWRAPDVLARIRALLPGLPAGAPMEQQLLLNAPAEEEQRCGGAACWPARCSPSSSLAAMAWSGWTRTPRSGG
ncbi:hypothetical protein [Dankookia sp. P2]|uniref:hypothetical protein n=1 Tax=Dankookia sp. P2 TaxID=3423955 RepID=UPI003D6791D9